ncbi:hypothetical protein JBE04_06540 [Streptomyces sp. PRKS01-29]|nr:hypothetical protein [Streptomyces sabulosicollis]MBI0294146.1 hypothetical protein [Streptomyces sabulosicollis]
MLALPRGGAPVAYEVATALDAELDVLLVRKLGVPGRDEVAMGAIASGGVVVPNEDIIRGLDISPEAVRRVASGKAGNCCADSGCTAATAPCRISRAGRSSSSTTDSPRARAPRAAVQALRRMRPGRIVVAVPAAPESTCQELSMTVDEVICATAPNPFAIVVRNAAEYGLSSSQPLPRWRTTPRAGPGPRRRRCPATPRRPAATG